MSDSSPGSGTAAANTATQPEAQAVLPPTADVLPASGTNTSSPWVGKKAIRNCSALVFDDQTSGLTGMPDNSPALNELMARASITCTWNLPWAVSQRQATDTNTGVVRWEIIEPQNPAACRIR